MITTLTVPLVALGLVRLTVSLQVEHQAFVEMPMVATFNEDVL
jgi:hypothetical protein